VVGFMSIARHCGRQSGRYPRLTDVEWWLVTHLLTRRLSMSRTCSVTTLAQGRTAISWAVDCGYIVTGVRTAFTDCLTALHPTSPSLAPIASVTAALPNGVLSAGEWWALFRPRMVATVPDRVTTYTE